MGRREVLYGVAVVLGVGALVLLALVVPDVVDSVSNWIFNKDSDLELDDLAVIGVALVAAGGAIFYNLLRAARWLDEKIKARRAARAEPPTRKETCRAAAERITAPAMTQAARSTFP